LINDVEDFSVWVEPFFLNVRSTLLIQDGGRAWSQGNVILS
jgi:hypothetical protein